MKFRSWKIGIWIFKCMKISDISKVLNARVAIGGDYLDREVEFACASDLMSDVLTIEKHNILLITGMATIQTMRTAEMSDAAMVLLVRNKKATPEMKAIANQNNLVILEYEGSMFQASGLLFKAGIKPLY